MFVKYTQGYSINRQEKESELNENIATAVYWEYDSRIGRRWNVDPKTKPNRSAYDAFSNNPLIKIDPKGDDDFWSIDKKTGKATLVSKIKMAVIFGFNEVKVLF